MEFDTHRRLIGSGFTEVQAETLADEHVALLNSNLATKADMAEVNAQIEATKAELRVEIEKVKSGLLKWMVTVLIAQGGLIVAVVKLV